jgi:hypothetical protein
MTTVEQLDPELPSDAIRRTRALARDLRSDAIGYYLDLSWRMHKRLAVSHNLPERLAVSLTSYPPRYRTLARTVKSLLAQSVRPDSIILWIAHNNLNTLPGDILQLQEDGLDIRACEDLRSYNKIVHTLALPLRQFIVTADDDQYYHRKWLETLICAYRPGSKEVLCARAHRIRLDARGVPLSYSKWDSDVSEISGSSLLFPTGGGGVLYEPGIFHEDVTRRDLFLKLCPTADDVWLYWMSALNGATVRKVGLRRREITWRRSQDVALYRTVNRTANDKQIELMISRYGFPGSLESKSAFAGMDVM